MSQPAQPVLTFFEMQRSYMAVLIVEFDGNIHDMVKASGLARATIYRWIDDFKLYDDLALARLTRQRRAPAQFEKEMQ